MDELIGQNVVLDVEAMFVYVGTLTQVNDKTIILENADVHDLRDSATTRERYVLDSRMHGIRANRKSVMVQRSQIVSVSALDDVLD